MTQTAIDNDDYQLEIILDNITEWNEVITKSRLPAALNLQALMSRIHKKILYPLPATTLTQIQLQRASNMLYKKSLPKCGIIRTFPIRFRTLPCKFFGLGLPDLYLEMQIGKLKEFLQQSNSNTVLGQQLQFNLEDMQLRTGVQGLILNYNHNKYSPLVYSGWLAHMWKFTSEMGYQFHGWKNHLKYQRVRDKFIMEELVQSGIPQKTLLVMNECRMYLRVITLADITNGRGDLIAQNYLDGRRDESRRSTLQWPDCNRPNFNAWLLWSSTLRKVFCTSDTGKRLKYPLGNWLYTKYNEWDWYYDVKNELLYNVQERHIIKYTHTTERRSSTRLGCTRYKAREILKSKISMEHLERASITKESRGIQMVTFHGSAKIQHVISNTISEHPNLLHIIQSSDITLPPLHMHNFSNIKTCNIKKLLTQPIRIVADGSYKQQRSSYCTIIESTDTEVQIVLTGSVVENGQKHDKRNTDPYRSEMMGLYMGLLVIKIIETYTNTHTRVFLSSDNDSALESIGNYSWSNVDQQHFDIISASIQLRLSMRSSIHIEYVQGHADKKNLDRSQTRTERLNQSCDILAKITRDEAAPIGPSSLPFEGLSLWHENAKIYHDFGDMIKNAYYNKKAKPILCTKFQWSGEQFDMTDWDSLQRSMQMLTSYSTIWISKYATGFLPIGKNMERRNEWRHNHCSRCGIALETSTHIGKCKESTSITLFRSSLETYEAWLDKMHTPVSLKIHIITRITAWRMDAPWHALSGAPLPRPVQRQLLLGDWSHFMEGRLHKEWQLTMQDHYDSISSRRTGIQWTSQCIQRIWKLFHISQWHHRNKFVHNTTEATKISRKREELQSAVKDNFLSESKHNLLVKDQHLYDQSLSQLLTSSDDVMISWLKDFQLAIRDRNENYQVTQKSFNNLRTWLVPQRATMSNE